ncbi:rod shape-determining protein MreC [Luteimonas aquatica]|uniref:rod shape-determining protein MreC n=1 Tax=Luteimonas aquatica TaxID=450364 RepID=UPI003CE56C70
MPAYASPTPSNTGDVASTLRLLAFLALSIALIVLDHRGGWLSAFRAQANVAVQPLWWLAGLPARLGDSMREDAATRTRLSEENRRLRNQILVGNARQARLQVAAAENERLRGLLGAAGRGGLDVQLAPILDIDLDPTRQRLILNAGSRNGVRLGQSVIDAGGLVGQIIEVTPTTATVLLITDPDHAVPVAVARNGVRLIAYGKGRSDELDLANIPLSSDVKEGDVIITSGIGGRFPAGFPVGEVAELHPDDSRAFLVGKLKPAAQLDRGRDVLLLRSVAAAAATAAPVATSPMPLDPVSAATATRVELPAQTPAPAGAGTQAGGQGAAAPAPSPAPPPSQGPAR